jgi:hypothetical protein
MACRLGEGPCDEKFSKQDPTICEQQLEEDLADQTPRILYVPKDVIITPFIVTARAAWVLLGMTRPPF